MIGNLDYIIDFILNSFKWIKAELCLTISQQNGVKVRQRYTYINGQTDSRRGATFKSLQCQNVLLDYNIILCIVLADLFSL